MLTPASNIPYHTVLYHAQGAVLLVSCCQTVFMFPQHLGTVQLLELHQTLFPHQCMEKAAWPHKTMVVFSWVLN